MPEPLNYIIPQAPTAIDERLARHQLRREFTYEVEQRQAHAAYCQWYRQVAAQHRQEFAAMQNDVNLLGWFVRRRGS